jgi:hypothetical protein|tara:strand:+ start:3551 stop:3940 length:390 start_codon:yes stop_codon:yes gene_type:complete
MIVTKLIKAGLLIKTGVWLRPRIKKVIFFLAAILSIWVAHDEYLDYVGLSGESRYLALSYVFKWIMTLLMLMSYYYFSKKYQEQSIKIIRRKGLPADNSKKTQETGNDGFDFLRNKDVLESKADRILNK